MTTINLKDFYSWHTHDEYIEVSDEVAAELRAERVLMETLESLAGASSGGHGALASLQAASAAWGKPAPDDALAVLARALS